jgi:hypothetical protein
MLTTTLYTIVFGTNRYKLLIAEYFWPLKKSTESYTQIKELHEHKGHKRKQSRFLTVHKLGREGGGRSNYIISLL